MDPLPHRDRAALSRSKQRAAWLSVAATSIAVAAKLAVAALTGSTAILSESAHSASDLAAALIALVTVRSADRPPDAKHPFGHQKFEHLSGVLEGALIVAMAGAIATVSVFELGSPVSRSGLGIATMLVFAGVNVVVSRRVHRVATSTGSAALEADAAHLRADVLTSLGAALALTLVAVTGINAIDQVMAAAIALLTAVTGVRLIIGGVRVLVDEAVPADEVSEIRAVLDRSADEGVRNYHRLRARRSGRTRHIDVHVMVDRTMTVEQAHEITDRIEAEIEARLPDADVVIHVEPSTHLPEQDASLL